VDVVCSCAVVRQVAARTLGDIVRKLGEKVLPELIPILERGLDSDDSDRRQGVCVGLSEIMSSTSRDHVSIGDGGSSSHSSSGACKQKCIYLSKSHFR